MSATDHLSPPLDPECGAAWRAFSDAVYDGGSPSLSDELLELARMFAPTLEATLSGRPYTERTIHIPGPAGEIALSVFTPDGHQSPSPGVLWIHGGGMALGDRFGAADALDAATAVGAVLVSVEYRRAPEDPAPAPGDDCLAAARWFGEHAAEVGVDPERVILAGGSAGGGLAAATALALRDHGGPHFAGLMLLFPMLDDRMTTVSTEQFADGVPWTRSSNEYGWGALLGDRLGTDRVTIYEAPGRATDLSGLPPAYIDVGSADMFRDEDVAFASTIWASGGSAELHVWSGGFHGYDSIAPHARLSADTLDARRNWLTRTLTEAGQA